MPLAPLKSALGLPANQALRKSKMSCTLVTPSLLKSAAHPKAAVMVVESESGSEQGMVPVHGPPDQPRKVECVEGVAVSVTNVSRSKRAEHVPPQLMPGRSVVTVPEPLPAFCTVRVRVVSGMERM